MEPQQQILGDLVDFVVLGGQLVGILPGQTKEKWLAIANAEMDKWEEEVLAKS